jgi:hypothetical protein
MCISSNAYTERNYKFDFTKLEYSKTPEEEQKEKELVAAAEYWLECKGIEIKTNYGYYRNTYDILKDLGSYLIKNNMATTPNLCAVAIEERTEY